MVKGTKGSERRIEMVEFSAISSDTTMCPKCSTTPLRRLKCLACNGNGGIILNILNKNYRCEKCKGTGVRYFCPNCKINYRKESDPTKSLYDLTETNVGGMRNIKTGTISKICTACNGKGYKETMAYGHISRVTGYGKRQIACPFCKGTGRIQSLT